MRIYTHGTFLKLREYFRTWAELGAVINRGKSAIMRRLQTDFTENEKRLILQYLGIEDTAENREEIFAK